MSCDIFTSWFKNQFVPNVNEFLKSKNLPRKALLILDNAPTHPNAKFLQDGDIRVMYLPPNVTSIAQPIDQGVLECMKEKYRRIFLQKILSDNETDLVQKLKSIDLLDVINCVSTAWNEVEPITILKS